MNEHTKNFAQKPEKRSRKLEIFLLAGVLVMQIAIFIALLSPKLLPDNNTPKNNPDTKPKNVISATNSIPANKQISPFTTIDNKMACLMNEFFNDLSPHHNSRNMRIHRSMLQQLNNAMNSMKFFDDMINIDSGWDRINVSPAMDMREKKNTYEIRLSIPDGSSSNVTVELNGQLLSMYIPIHIKTHNYNEYRTYKQQILIPGPISSDKAISTTISNNIIRIILPKGTERSFHQGYTKLL